LQQSLPECLKAAISREICIIIIVHHHFYTCLSLSLSFAVLCFVAIRSLIGLVFFQGSETAGASRAVMLISSLRRPWLLMLAHFGQLSMTFSI
jgi:hypothetical protein